MFFGRKKVEWETIAVKVDACELDGHIKVEPLYIRNMDRQDGTRMRFISSVIDWKNGTRNNPIMYLTFVHERRL